MNTCTRADLEVIIDAQIQVDDDGQPILDTQAINNSMNIDVYTCNNCGEQFGSMGWQEALDHIKETK